MPFCRICHEYYAESFNIIHKCPDKWKVWDFNDDKEEDHQTAFGRTPERALEHWAEHRDRSDDALYPIASGNPRVMCVKRYTDDPETPTHIMIVRGRTEPVYTAEDISDQAVKVMAWNAKHPMGTKVRCESGLVECKTTSPARLEDDHQAEVRVDVSPYHFPLKDIEVIE